MLGEVLGGLFGSEAGDRLVRRSAARAEQRAKSQLPVRIRARAQLDGVPDYRVLRGRLIRRGDTLGWRPGLLARATPFTVVPLRRWQVGPFDLSTARCIGSHPVSSASRGDRHSFQLVSAGPVQSLEVPAPFARAAGQILRYRP